MQEAKQKEEEERKRKETEEIARIEREEIERKAREEAEKQKIETAEKLRKEEKEREERRKRVEAIMSRTRKGGNPNNTPNKVNHFFLDLFLLSQLTDHFVSCQLLGHLVI